MLGAGSMARAILACLLAPHVSVDGAVRVTNRSAENATRFDTEPRVQAWATANDPEANIKAVAGAQIVLVAVKPAMVVQRNGSAPIPIRTLPTPTMWQRVCTQPKNLCNAPSYA